MGTILDTLVGLPPWLILALVFLLPALEASILIGVVVPGEVAVLIGGVVAHAGRLPLWLVIVAAILGAVLGDSAGYELGRRFGPPLLQRLPGRFQRSGQVDRALDLVRRRGSTAVLLGRWTAALRALVPGIAGISRLPFWKFLAANIVGGATWATAVVLLGYFAGAGYRRVEQQLGLGSELLLAVVVVIAVVWIVVARRRARVPR
ncbi:MAG TPA: DedA family protein [Kribbella sp.]|nr:DedA family protein [Kribbella sp.]